MSEQTETSYLLANGWRPSPTTWCPEGGFEHPRLCRVPRALTEGEGTYDAHEIRMPKTVAFVVQAVHEQRVRDELLETATWQIGSICAAIAAHCTKVWRLERPR